MNQLGRLEQLLLQGRITMEQYEEKKATYIEVLLDLYLNDIITKEELYERIND